MSEALFNVFCLVDALLGTLQAVIVDTAYPLPGPGRTDTNDYWRNSITLGSGNPVAIVMLSVDQYNSLSLQDLEDYIASPEAVLNYL
jgi:hypothetical protein